MNENQYIVRAWRRAGWLGLIVLTLVTACGLLPKPGPPAAPAPTNTSTITPTPFQVTGSGALIYTLPTDTADQIASLEFNPAQKELLINVVNGALSRVDRVQWTDPVLKQSTISDQISQAHYSPDGQRLVFDGLTTSDANGTNRQALTTGDSGASWSPDGKQLAFVRLTPNDPGCSAADAESCASLFIIPAIAPIVLPSVTPPPPTPILSAGFLGGTPRWSPDQKYVLVQQGGEAGTTLTLIDILGRTLTALVPNPATPPDAVGFSGVTWAPDSRSVIYSAAGGGLWVQSITADSSGNLPPPTSLQPGTQPYWPPGKWLYYLASVSATPSAATPDPSALIPEQVWRLDPSNPANSAQRLLDTPITCNASAWSLKADILACAGPVNDQAAITLYAIPVTP